MIANATKAEYRKHLNSLTIDQITTRVNTGFCQQKFYKPTAWQQAKRIMEIACALGLAEPFDFGRGKGKYITNHIGKDIIAGLLKFRSERD